METVTEGEVFADGAGYGLRLQLSDGTELVQPNIDTTPQSVRRLLARLRGEQIDSEQLRYIIEDHLVSEYTVKR